jgi:hypothetical protein
MAARITAAFLCKLISAEKAGKPICDFFHKLLPSGIAPTNLAAAGGNRSADSLDTPTNCTNWRLESRQNPHVGKPALRA